MDAHNHQKVKTGRTLFKNKLILSLFALLFAGIGIYAIVGSHAATAPYVHVCVQYEGGGGDCVSTIGSPGIAVGVHTNPVPNSNAHCQPTNNTTQNYGVTDSQGSVTFICDAVTYDVYADPPGGYISTHAQVTAEINTYKSVTVFFQRDTDGDGYPDSSDACPSLRGGAPNGCPHGNTTLRVSSSGIAATTGNITVDNGATYTLTATTQYTNNCVLRTNGDAIVGPVKTSSDSNLNTTSINQSKTIAGNYAYYVNCSDAFGTANSNALQVTVRSAPTTQPQQCPSGTHGTYPNCVPDQTGCVTNCGPPPCTSNCGGTTKKSTTKATSAAVANDTVAPNTPTNLAATQTDPGSIDLSWDPSTDNIGVDHYVVERSQNNSTWTEVSKDAQDTSYTDADILFNNHYYYRVFAVDVAGNRSGASTTADITSQAFSANVTADKGATIHSDDKIVTAIIPDGAVTEDAFCEIVQDTTRLTPKSLKLVAGSYQVNCKNSTGDPISSFEKDADITMALKKFTSFKDFKAYTIEDTDLSPVAGVFNKGDMTLKFSQSDLQPFAAYGAKKGHGILFWLLLPLLIIGAVYGLIRYRNSRSGGNDTYYDTTGYVSMPPSVPVAPTGGYEHHQSLPEMVAQGGLPPVPPQPPYPPQQPVPPQYQDPNQPQPPQPA